MFGRVVTVCEVWLGGGDAFSRSLAPSVVPTQKEYCVRSLAGSAGFQVKVAVEDSVEPFAGEAMVAARSGQPFTPGVQVV